MFVVSQSMLDLGINAGPSLWWRSQGADHIYKLTMIFTLLVVIAATQGQKSR